MSPEKQLKADRRAAFFHTLRTQGYTFKQIGDRFGLSDTRIAQIVNREKRRIEYALKTAATDLYVIERTLTFPRWTKAISKVDGPLIDTGLDPTIASGGST
jgi:transcriptional regulator with XRE-family HTH domain